MFRLFFWCSQNTLLVKGTRADGGANAAWRMDRDRHFAFTKDLKVSGSRHGRWGYVRRVLPGSTCLSLGEGGDQGWSAHEC